MSVARTAVFLGFSSLLVLLAGCVENSSEDVPAEPGKTKNYVVYDFWAEWCGPCKSYAPTFERFEAKYTRPNVSFKRVNIDQDRTTAAKFRIEMIPTVVVTADNKEVARFMGGVKSEKQLLKALQ